jgi:hypothetical protein
MSLALNDQSSDIRRQKNLFVICSAVSCQGFLRARNHLRLKKQTLRGATTMHETEQPTPQQASPKQPEAKEAKPVDGKSQG